jgi:hypothetical protein
MVSCALQGCRQFPQTLHDEGRMCLASRCKILLHPKVDLQHPTLKPAPAACSKVRRLSDLWNSQHVPVKRSGFILTPGRHGKLNVVYVTDLHRAPRMIRMGSLAIHLEVINAACPSYR